MRPSHSPLLLSCRSEGVGSLGSPCLQLGGGFLGFVAPMNEHVVHLVPVIAPIPLASQLLVWSSLGKFFDVVDQVDVGVVVL